MEYLWIFDTKIKSFRHIFHAKIQIQIFSIFILAWAWESWKNSKREKWTPSFFILFEANKKHKKYKKNWKMKFILCRKLVLGLFYFFQSPNITIKFINILQSSHTFYNHTHKQASYSLFSYFRFFSLYFLSLAYSVFVACIRNFIVEIFINF